nr:MAG TPA: hypothetical protein [Caudoviricetes sp.]
MRPIFLGIFSIEKDDIIAVNNVVFYVKILSILRFSKSV